MNLTAASTPGAKILQSICFQWNKGTRPQGPATLRFLQALDPTGQSDQPDALVDGIEENGIAPEADGADGVRSKSAAPPMCQIEPPYSLPNPRLLPRSTEKTGVDERMRPRQRTQ